MEKLEEFLYNQYDGTLYSSLPKIIKRKVDALKNLQLEHIKLQAQYNKRIQELELEFEKLHRPLYDKRAAIISGEYEPTDEECQLPPNLSENEFNGDQENSTVSEDRPIFTEEEEKEISSKIKGIPGFWLGCMNSTYNFGESIEDHDRQVLRYIKDIKLTYNNSDDVLSYRLDFIFNKNPFFTNEVLTKTYYLKSKPDEKNPFSYDGFEVFKSEGCEINWNPGKDVTTKKKRVKQLNKKTGESRSVDKEVELDSFFFFFQPPQLPEGGVESIDEEMGALMALDFELGELIRQSLIPRASLYYAGYLVDDDDEDDIDSMDDDDDDDSMDDDDDDDDDDDALSDRD